jgi:hypothetical protein
MNWRKWFEALKIAAPKSSFKKEAAFFVNRRRAVLNSEDGGVKIKPLCAKADGASVFH